MADFATSIRQDAGGQYEGVTSVAIDFKKVMFSKSWLQPGLTFNDIYQNKNGKYLVKVPGKYNADITALCDETAATGKIADTLVAVDIDKKISTVIDSCFISKGITGDDEANALNTEMDYAAESIREVFEANVLDYLITNGTEYTSAETGVLEQLLDARKAYKDANNTAPTVALISTDFEFELQKEVLAGNAVLTQTGNTVLVEGSIGNVLGMELIAVESGDEAFDVVLYDWNYLTIPVAKDAVSNVDELSQDGRAIQFMEAVNAKSGTRATYLHFNFGLGILRAEGVIVLGAVADTGGDAPIAEAPVEEVKGLVEEKKEDNTPVEVTPVDEVKDNKNKKNNK